MKQYSLLLMLLVRNVIMVLKGISPILSADLLHVLASMGHGDMLVLADSNFPSASVSTKVPCLVRADGHPIPNLLEAILQLLPLDTQQSAPVGHSIYIV